MYGLPVAICWALVVACGGVKTGELWGLGSDQSPEGLYTIDLDTGNATLIHPFDFNPNEGALALGPDGVLYAAFSGEFDELITINRDTGELTVVGPLGFDDVSGLAFSPDGVLYGCDLDTDQLITVDLDTGQGTAVGPIGFSTGGGLSFAPDGTLFAVGQGAIHLPATTLWTVDLESGAAKYIDQLGWNLPFGFMTSSAAVSFVGEALYISGSFLYDNDGGSQSFLYLVDPATGSADEIGPFVGADKAMGGLAFVPGAGDGDRDGDVDLDDLAFFQGCLTGPLQTEESLPLECLLLDFDNDNDIDLHDYATFQAGFTGRDEANSFLEFSDTQGQDNWYYGYYEPLEDPDGVYDASDFIELPLYGLTELVPNLCWVIALEQSPHVRVCRDQSWASLPEDGLHWPIWRWISELDAAVTISGHFAKLEDSFACGNGIVGRVLISGEEVYSQFIAPDDDVGIDFEVTVEVTMGEPVDFVMDPLEDADCDFVTFTSIITRAQNQGP